MTKRQASKQQNSIDARLQKLENLVTVIEYRMEEFKTYQPFYERTKNRLDTLEHAVSRANVAATRANHEVCKVRDAAKASATEPAKGTKFGYLATMAAVSAVVFLFLVLVGK